MRLIVMQATNGCNLNCNYCYVPNRRDYSRMSLDVVLRTAESAFALPPVGDRVIEFLWHCGEPLAAGLDFYKQAFEVIDKTNTKRLPVRHSMQTNGTLVNAKWCELFLEWGVNIGLSIDGPRDLHDAGRRDWGGNGSFDRTMNGYYEMRSAGIRPGALCVVTREHLANAERIIRFFCEEDFHSVGFNIEEVDNAHTTSSLIGETTNHLLDEEFEIFLMQLFRAWWPFRERLAIREFNDTIRLAHHWLENPSFRRLPDEVQDGGIFTVSQAGNVTPYSPEFAGSSAPEYVNFTIGNVLETTFTQMMESEAYSVIRGGMHAHLMHCEKECQYHALCGGSYASNVFFEHGTLNKAESTACRLLRKKLVEVIATEALIVQ